MTSRAGVLAIAALLLPACNRPAEAPEGKPVAKSPQLHATSPAEASERPVLAESANQAIRASVQVLDARRIAPDTVRLELAVVNRAPAAASATAASGAPADGASLETAMASLEGMSLVSEDGRRRVFPLQDAAGKLVWSGVEPPPPGERRQFWVCFPAPAGERPQVRLAVPGWPVTKAVEVRQPVK